MSIESIEARLAKATEGLWWYSRWSETPNAESKGGYLLEVSTPDDRDFIAHSRQDIPALLKVAKAAKAFLDVPRSSPDWLDATELIAVLAELEAME